MKYFDIWYSCIKFFWFLYSVTPGVLPAKLGGGVRPASQNSYPIYDQNLRYSLLYLWPDQKFEPYLWPDLYTKILFQTCSLVQTSV